MDVLVVAERLRVVDLGRHVGAALAAVRARVRLRQGDHAGARALPPRVRCARSRLLRAPAAGGPEELARQVELGELLDPLLARAARARSSGSRRPAPRGSARARSDRRPATAPSSVRRVASRAPSSWPQLCSSASAARTPASAAQRRCGSSADGPAPAGESRSRLRSSSGPRASSPASSSAGSRSLRAGAGARSRVVLGALDAARERAAAQPARAAPRAGPRAARRAPARARPGRDRARRRVARARSLSQACAFSAMRP